METDLNTKFVTRWLNRDQAISELLSLKFAFASLVETCGTPGSYQREMAVNAGIGVKQRIDYLHDSFTRLLGEGK